MGGMIEPDRLPIGVTKEMMLESKLRALTADRDRWQKRAEAAEASIASMLDDMLVFLSKRHYPTPEKTYKHDGGWNLAIEDLRRLVDFIIANRDGLLQRAESAESFITEAQFACQQLEEAEEERDALAATVNVLREALREAIETLEEVRIIPEGDTLRAALAANPAKNLGRLKASALREAANLIRQTTPDLRSDSNLERGRFEGRYYAIEQIEAMADAIEAGECA